MPYRHNDVFGTLKPVLHYQIWNDWIAILMSVEIGG